MEKGNNYEDDSDIKKLQVYGDPVEILGEPSEENFGEDPPPDAKTISLEF